MGIISTDTVVISWWVIYVIRLSCQTMGMPTCTCSTFLLALCHAYNLPSDCPKWVQHVRSFPLAVQRVLRDVHAPKTMILICIKPPHFFEKI